MAVYDVVRYDSMREYADAGVAGYEKCCERLGLDPKTTTRGVGGHPSSNKRYENGWCGVTGSIYEARDLAINGWREGAGALTDNLDRIMPRLREFMDTEPEPIPQVYGDVWDLQEYLNGNPEYAWESVPTDQVRGGNVVTVLMNFTASWKVSAETLAFRGALVLACMECLQLAGYEMQVFCESVINAWSGKYNGRAVLTRVKAAGDPIDLQSYSFMTEPGYFRRLMFGCMEGWEDGEKNYGAPGGGYGSCGPLYSTKLVGANLALHLGEDQGWPVYWDGSGDDPATLKRAEEWVKQTVESISTQTVIGGSVG